MKKLSAYSNIPQFFSSQSGIKPSELWDVISLRTLMTRSKYFLLFCIAFIFGILLGSYFSISIWILFLEAGFFISLVFLFRDNKKARMILLLAIFILLGFIRIESGKLSENKISEIESLDKQKILAEGKILQAPEIKNGKQKIVIKNIKNIENGSNINGKIIVYADRYPEYNFTDKIRLKGKIKIPEDFDGFEYKNYLFSKGIYYIAYYPEIETIERNDAGINFQIAQFRIYANNIIKKIFPEPQAGIVSAMTLGVKSSISSETLESFNKTGTRHIIAISGLHMTIVSVVFMYLLLAVGLRRSYAFYFAIL
ncbi:MAG: ComEC family DNA internalization-related competence protein, partial [Candidatus Pacebacteria bacterium]|nr:ComEC family DNA internalization-related competence protein [Candidatus Paceibacterota bacterium]